MLSLIDKPPVLINNFLHQKMRLLNTYGDCRRYTELWCKIGSQKGVLT